MGDSRENDDIQPNNVPPKQINPLPAYTEYEQAKESNQTRKKKKNSAQQLFVKMHAKKKSSNIGELTNS